MSRKMQPVYYCDPCEKQGRQVEGTEHTIALGDMPRKRALIFCDEHEKPLLELQRLVADVIAPPVSKTGQKKSRSGKKPATKKPAESSSAANSGELACDLCGFTVTGMKRPGQAMAMHRRRVHNLDRDGAPITA